MKHADLPERWQNRLKEYLISIDSGYDVLLASDFPSYGVKIGFEDGSSVDFKYAILIDAPELSEVGLFTEHCGYHIFSRNALASTQRTADSNN